MFDPAIFDWNNDSGQDDIPCKRCGGEFDPRDINSDGLCVGCAEDEENEL